jgi:FkbM family methyltransferase
MIHQLFKKMPDFKGKRRLGKLLMQKKIEQARDVKVTGKYNCKYVLPNLKETIGYELYLNGIYEKEIIDFLNKSIPSNGRFLDIGANIGAISIPIAKNRKDVSIIAVEAATPIFNYLANNVNLNLLENIQLVNKAVYDKDDLEVDFYNPIEKYGKGSMSPVFTGESIKVTTITLNKLVQDFSFSPIDVIKIDVEGFEYFVFKGGDRLLKADNAPLIIFEFVDWAERAASGLQPGDAQKLLKSFGYRLYALEKNRTVELDSTIETGSNNLIATKQPL